MNAGKSKKGSAAQPRQARKSAGKAANPSQTMGPGRPSGKIPKNLAYLVSGVLLLFTFAGIIAAATLELSGLKLLAPILLGPGITVLGLGLLYDFTIRPLASFHEKLHSMIARTYFVLGGLFSVLGLVFWYAG